MYGASPTTQAVWQRMGLRHAWCVQVCRPHETIQILRPILLGTDPKIHSACHDLHWGRLRRFAAYPAPQPVVVRNSQADWLRPADFSRAAVVAAIGHHPLHRCTAAGLRRGVCSGDAALACGCVWDHSTGAARDGPMPPGTDARYARVRGVGADAGAEVRALADHGSSRAADLAALGLTTYADLLQAQVRAMRLVLYSVNFGRCDHDLLHVCCSCSFLFVLF